MSYFWKERYIRCGMSMFTNVCCLQQHLRENRNKSVFSTMPPKKAAPAPVKATGSRTSTVSKPKATPAARGGKTTATKKPSITTKPAGKTDKPAEPKKKAWTPQDEAARKIQTKARQFLAKKEIEKKKKEKQDYEDLMDKLEKEAFIHMVKMQQEEAERKAQKEDEERKRRQQEIKRRKRMLEAAYDGDLDIMKEVLKEVSDIDTKNGIGNDVIGRSLRTKHLMAVIDCEDANGNTPLSEAANGGSAEAIRFLLEKGAEPNSQGQFLRTPLYRSAFIGSLEATQVLLENGADPRICASDSQTPLEVASTEGVRQVLENWDVSQTEVLQKKIEEAKEKRAEEDRQRRDAETSKMEDVLAEAEKDYQTKQKQLNHAYCELNKRITEHDTCVGQGFDRPELTLQTIHDQELEVETLKIDVAKARDNLAKARLMLRESMAAEDEEVEDQLPGLKILVKDLDEVLFRDVGNRIKDSGKWPLLIDPSGQASTFLRYRDTNCVNALRPADMENNNVRRSLLGAIRFGKPFVVDMMEVDMFQTCCDRFEEIQPGLMAAILDKSILEEEKYVKLIKKEDGPEYERTKFNDMRLANFKFMLVTKNPFPSEKLLNDLYVIRISLPD
ncbi:IQ motif and ankyrin repeat domain-containing protein 1 isoform X2 [Aplysia californica]|uniref:IQ motif and ankyrin repeat domain-containing protein 1 isoform X2 n=1 Tax=Aplysia californica TaxID=6500 RepID=A0ABM1A759_APLCA|nr:IQ motif and ankyrin repeat domain-containing protein 1 isoform X2 [Aplysia californica]